MCFALPYTFGFFLGPVLCPGSGPGPGPSPGSELCRAAARRREPVLVCPWQRGPPVLMGDNNSRTNLDQAVPLGVEQLEHLLEVLDLVLGEALVLGRHDEAGGGGVAG